jgi:hypothetical protein
MVSKTLSLSVAASVPENETGYPYPSGSKVATVRALGPDTGTATDGSYTGSTGLYGFYIDGRVWKVFRFSSSFTVYCYSDYQSSYPYSYVNITGSSNYYYENKDTSIEVIVYKIKD